MRFDITLTGLQAINKQLETVSNNIANSGTYGFKSSRANFSSLYSGKQLNGVEVGSMTQSIETGGAIQNTGRSLDAAITGRGFFVSRDDNGASTYSRVGIFNVSTDGNLVDSAGRKVQGFAAPTDVKTGKLAVLPPGAPKVLGLMGNITVPTGQLAAAPSTKLSYVGNLSADWTTPLTTRFDPADSTSYNMVRQSLVYDSLGTQHTVSQYFINGATTGTTHSVSVYYGFDGVTSMPAPPTAATVPDVTLTFDSAGHLTDTGAGTGTSTTPNTSPVPFVNPNLSALTGIGANALALTIDYTGTTRFAGDSNLATNSADGYAAGTFVGVDLAADGSVVAKYSNQQQLVVGTVALATFANEGALTSISDTSWSANLDSGSALYGSPGTGLNSKLATGALEGSNVDVTSELVSLMTSQRNYQANSKVISTENSMSQALMQAL